MMTDEIPMTMTEIWSWTKANEPKANSHPRLWKGQ